MADHGAIGKSRGRPNSLRSLDLWQNQYAAALPISRLRRPFLRKQAMPLLLGDLFTSFKRPNNGVISGIVTEDGDPVPHCLVRLYDRATGLLMESTFSDGLGLFSFTGYDQTIPNAFFAVAFDPAGGVNYNALIFDRITPIGNVAGLARTVSAVGSESFVSGNHTMIPYYGWNPADKTSGIILSNSNFTAGHAAGQGGVRSLNYKSAGKWYVEFLNSGYGGGGFVIGVARSAANLSNFIGSDSNGWGCDHSGNCYTSGARVGSLSSGPSLNVRMGMAIDLDNGKLWYHTGGTWTGNPAGGSGSVFSGITGNIFLALTCSYYRPGTIYTDPTLQAYSAPAGFTAGWPSA